MVVDAVSRMSEYDTAVIMSGDSDFVSLVNLLRGKNKKVVIVSTRWHVAKDLIQAAEHYFDINKFKTVWEYGKKP
jgi:uncharacterized LabA/DUF88 family protein